jgi:two-component system sensor histidine kinase KdpD
LRGIKDQIYSHRIRIFMPKNLPLVKADFILTEQALANLVVNAVTHTLPGTPVEIIGQIENCFFALTVSDEGPGLPPDQLERIFDPFQRGGTTKTGFIEIQGGHVKAINGGIGGAAFTIYLNAIDNPSLPQEIL